MRVSPKGNWIELVIISALFVLLSLWGIVWDVTSGLLAGGIDGIMLAAVCGMTALIFAAMLVVQLQKAGILPSFGRKAKAAAAAAPSARPAAAPPTAATPKPAPAPTSAKSTAPPSQPSPTPQPK